MADLPVKGLKASSSSTSANGSSSPFTWCARTVFEAKLNNVRATYIAIFDACTILIIFA